MRELLLSNDHYLGRLVAQIAHGVGVPMTLFRIDDTVLLPPSDLVDRGFKTFIDQVGNLNDAEQIASWMNTSRNHHHRIFASGRRYEHPFVTLLRDEPWWSVWELAVLREAFSSGEANDEGPQESKLPGMLGDLLQLKTEAVPALGGHMVYGPVPRERGFVDAEIRGSIRRFVDATLVATKIPGAPKGGGYSSYERLRRMYFANGRVVDKLFDRNVERASAAFSLCMNADVNVLRGNSEIEASVLPSLDVVSSVALTRVEHPRNAAIVLRGPAAHARDVEIVSDKAGNLEVSILASQVDNGTESYGAESAGINISSHVPSALNDTLQHVIAQAEERSAQATLQQFMLMRHWLNDRFARLSPMFNGERVAAGDAARSLEEIVEWLIRMFDADFAAIYHVAPGGFLDEIGCGSRGSSAAAAAAENSERMRMLREAEPQKRASSSAYRALRQGTSEEVRDWDGLESNTGMSSARPGVEDRPRSTVAAPVVILGKTWGVIELVGFCPNQFVRISSMWLEEASQLVGNALYQTWLLKQITQSNLAVLLDRQEGEAILTDDDERNRRLIEVSFRDKEERILEIRNDICREMAELFIADGAALWLNNEQWPGVLQLSGWHGISYDPTVDVPNTLSDYMSPWPEIHIGSDDSLVARMMGEGGFANDSIPTELLEEPAQVTSTPREAYRRALWRSGVRRVSLVPLLETSSRDETSAIGAIALYSKGEPVDIDPYGRRWAPLVEFAGRHVAMLTRSIALESERQLSLELMFSHEVIGSLRRVQDQFKYLTRNLLDPLARGRRPETLQSPERLRDIDKASSRVGNGIDDAVDRLDEMRRDGFQMPSAGLLDFRSKAKWNREPTVLYNAIQSGFNARYKLRVSRGIDWRITGTTEYLRIKLPPRDLETLFYNLADNALKYATKGTSIRVNIERRATGNLWVDFHNEAPPLRPGEEDRLFKLGFRGQLARNGVEDGSGQGLFITNRLAQALGVGLDYEPTPQIGRSDVDHRFRLIFGGEFVLYGRD